MVQWSVELLSRQALVFCFSVLETGGGTGFRRAYQHHCLHPSLERLSWFVCWQVPDTAYALDHMRPDMVLLMVLGKSLILWDTIEPTEVSGRGTAVFSQPSMSQHMTVFWHKFPSPAVDRARC